MTPLTEEHIWDILDGEAQPEMRAQHEAQLLADDSYRTTFVQCEQLHRQLLNLPLESPSMRFTENLMERLVPEKRTAPQPDRLPLIFLGFFTALSGLLATLIFSKSNLSTAEQSLNTEGVISILSNPLFVQTFVLLNIVLLLAVLDKKVLRPYFDNKAKLKRT
jgi:anti-sigma factor RsiW